MRDQNKCKVVLTPVNVPVDYVKTVEIGNNDTSPKEESLLEQGEEATDINPEPVKDDKSTGSNSDVPTTLLTEEEEEPPIISENPMEMENNDKSPKEVLSPEEGKEVTDINPEAVKDEKSTGCNAEVSTTSLTGQEKESPIIFENTMEMGNNYMSQKEELSPEEGEEATDINPEPVKDDKLMGSNSDVPTTLLTEEEEEPPIISENPMEMENNDTSPKEELSPEEGKEVTDINPEAVKDEKSTGCNAEVSTTLLTGQEKESPIIFENTMEMGNNYTSQKEELSLEEGEEATDINPEPVKDEKSTGSNAEVPMTLLTGQEQEPPVICEKEIEIGNTNMSPKEVLSPEEAKWLQTLILKL